MTETIYVVGYPRSGTTWLTRLLGDVLNCPTGCAVPASDAKEIATEGQDRPMPAVVRKAHFRLVDAVGGPAVLGMFRLAWRNLADERVVLIVRDPRDIAVSQSFYFRYSLEKALNNMTSDTGLLHWDEFITHWLDYELDFSLIKYENLVINSYEAITSLLECLQLPACLRRQADDERVRRAVHRQSFKQRTKWTKETLTGPVQISHLKFLRKGIVGDWRNHFTPEQERFAWDAFGKTMERLDYER